MGGASGYYAVELVVVLGVELMVIVAGASGYYGLSWWLLFVVLVVTMAGAGGCYGWC